MSTEFLVPFTVIYLLLSNVMFPLIWNVKEAKRLGERKRAAALLTTLTGPRQFPNMYCWRQLAFSSCTAAFNTLQKGTKLNYRNIFLSWGKVSWRRMDYCWIKLYTLINLWNEVCYGWWYIAGCRQFCSRCGVELFCLFPSTDSSKSKNTDQHTCTQSHVGIFYWCGPLRDEYISLRTQTLCNLWL